MYFIDFYTKRSVYNSNVNTGVIFTKLFWLGLRTASYRIILNWTLRLSSNQIPLKKPHGNKNLGVQGGSELMTPALFSLIYIVMERQL